MAGARLELESARVRATIGSMADGLEQPAPLLRQIEEYLHRIHRQRFREQRAPDGTPWKALSPKWQQRKHKNKDKILTFRGHLSGTLAGQIDDDGLLFGTNRIYGAIHHFGGKTGRKLAAFMPARPWLGTSEAQDNHILKITERYLENIAGA